jgi:hypothetical protein
MYMYVYLDTALYSTHYTIPYTLASIMHAFVDLYVCMLV